MSVMVRGAAGLTLFRRPARIATRSVAGGDFRTQPGVLTKVLTPGADLKKFPP